ncbi:nuclear pore complex protein Nup214-like [Diaphorina citri]|uniref:Nuclear pore complex protein Nup214-like n=1 Tax=Diaphorina citri TaxID=121845 RepID=A0A3Q0J2Q5_DIACI|nr:nuclear pore complex protein Nup214-like [Diaphorina citri]
MEPCPPGREVTDFQFKLFSSVRVFPAIDYQNFFNNPSNTVTASNKHGLLIVGTPTGFQIVNLAQFVSPNAAEFLNECTDYPRREYNINAQPSHIALNCDETLLSVAHQSSDNAPLVRIYKMASLTNQSKNKVVKIPLGPPGTCIMDFSWNPVIPDLLSVCVSNGCLCLYSHDDTGKKLTMLPPEKRLSQIRVRTKLSRYH